MTAPLLTLLTCLIPTISLAQFTILPVEPGCETGYSVADTVWPLGQRGDAQLLDAALSHDAELIQTTAHVMHSGTDPVCLPEQTGSYEVQVRPSRVNFALLPVSMIPFRDAVAIARLLSPTPRYADIKSYLLAYFKLVDGNPDSLRAAITANTFIKQALGSAATVDLIVNAVLSTRSPGDPMQFTVMEAGQKSLLNPTLVADALGTFIAKRFKEEINAAFLQRFRLLLTNNPDSLKLLFPESHSVLLNADPYNYTSFLQSLQEAFEQDLASLPKNTVNYLSYNRQLAATTLRSPVLFDVTLASLQLVGELQEGRPGLTVLSQLGNSRAVLSMQEPAVQHALQLLSLLARNSTTDTAGEQLLKREELAQLATDSTVLKLFLGLILAKEEPLLKSITVRPGPASKSLYTFINQDLSSSQSTFYKVISSVVTGAETFRLAKERILAEQQAAQALNNKPNLAPHYLSMLETGITILENSFDFYTIIAGTLAQTPVASKDAFAISRQCIPIVRNVWEKRYGLALSHSVTLLQTLFKTVPPASVAALTRKQKRLLKDADKLNVKVRSAFRGVPVQALSEAIATAKATVGAAAVSANVRETIGDGAVTGAVGNLMKYGSFMVTVVNATTKDEMLLALESAALPVGSYRIKRNTYFSVSINSFGGVYAGVQANEGGINFKALQQSSRGLIAPSAPVGFYAGWGKSQVKVLNKDRQANGIFVSLIDIGSIFAFRLNDANTADLPELTWQNIIAPGAYFIHSFSNVLSLGIGAQHGPQLRAIKDGTVVFDPQSWRYGLKLTADIPIFNLYTKANRKAL
ncbi:hypothetical protein [Fibrella arboris]|uniref:hypothetical protein n=1 Tax=Fibrella arboris TaxID=3242486 RepID=UPI0035222E4E